MKRSQFKIVVRFPPRFVIPEACRYRQAD